MHEELDGMGKERGLIAYDGVVGIDGFDVV